MSFKGFWLRITLFVVTLTFGLMAANIFRPQIVENKFQKTHCFPKTVKIEDGDGRSGVNNFGELPPKTVLKAPENKSDANLKGLTILSKPRANYTDEARINNVEGKVVLRVTFLANGEIGEVSTVSGLPDGLTEQAVAAARGIRFEPGKRHSKPVTMRKTVEYTFTIY